MKKTMLLLLTALLMLTACAEGAGFSFRGDIAWGMTQAQVLEAEGNPEYETDEDNGIKEIEIENVVYEGAPCDIMYGFLDDYLVTFSVEFDDDANAVTFSQLKSSLSQKYGDPLDGDAFLLGSQNANTASWHLSDNTGVALVEEKDGDMTIMALNGVLLGYGGK